VYALIRDGVIEAVRNPRTSGEFKLSDGTLLRPANGWTDALAALCGFVRVVDPGAPVLQPTQTLDPNTVTLLAGVPTVVYHVRNKTQAELDADAATALAELERQQARDAIADLDTFLALPTPTNAQTLAVVKLLCRIAKRLIRDAIGG
jgi:hypothetical protein